MKINRYECDLCGVQIPNGKEHKITIVYPYAASEMEKETLHRMNRTRTTIELCETCFADRLPEFIKGEKER